MRIRFRLASIALSGILVLLLVGLYAIDRALTSSHRLEMSLHAVKAGAVVQNVAVAQLGMLNSFQALQTEHFATADSVRFQSMAEVVVGTESGVERVWIADSTGRVVQEYRVLKSIGSLPEGLVLDTIRAANIGALFHGVRTTGLPRLSRPGHFFSSEPVLILIQPLSRGSRRTGYIGSSISTSAFHQAVRAVQWDSAATVITAGSDTIFQSAGKPYGRFVYSVSTAVPVVGDFWTVTVRKHASNLWLRLVLWSLGLAALPILVAGVLQERRAAVRVSERSAELERLSTELLRANRAKSEFLANVSHELRTPLNAIVGFVDLLRDGVYGELAIRQVSPVERIAASATHLRHLVDQVLDIAKMAAGRLEVHTEPLALRPFVLDVVSELESLLSERGLSLSIAVGASLPKVRTDPTHLRQILMNLLGNAMKYTTTGGVAVRARLVDPKGDPKRDSNYPGIPSPEKTWIALQVADSGIGIAAGDLERIFEEFEQVDSGSRGDSVTRGTGLGLPISRRLARLLGGEISVQSEIGHGSTFTLWLPVNPVDYRVGEHPALPEHGVSITGAKPG